MMRELKNFLKDKEKRRFVIMRTIGNFLVLFSLFGMFMTFGPAVYNEAVYRTNRLRGQRFIVKGDPIPKEAPKEKEEKERGFFGQILKAPKPKVLFPVDANFGIIIPKIGANARVLPNIDPGDHSRYMAALRLGVAHAQGTFFPGMNGNVYLFAHSTDNFWNVGRYNAIFYLLKELEEGDEVDVFFSGKRYIYIVYEKKIVEPNEVHYLTGQTKDGEQKLTLQTCWPPGTTLKRLLVFARPK